MLAEDPKQVLQEYFGYQSFRAGQQEIIANILEGHNTLGIMPTGGGKSICFQIPATCLAGVTIVFSPLISLMKDQIDSLKAVGIDATFINSSLTRTEIEDRLAKVQAGAYDLLYIAPERLDSRYFIRILNEIRISLVVVDEAHCISQWGHDFRPAYLLIPKFLEELTSNPVVAGFTATATKDVQADISRILDINNQHIFISSFDRENLTFKVIKGEDKRDFILEYVTTNKDVAGIIYAATRKEVDQIYSLLSDQGLAVGKYHAGLSSQVRKETQDDFLYDRIKIVVATNAFGMGIDKSNVRYIIHHNMPQDIESYYQEAGRAGRDGVASECVLLFSPADTWLPKYFIEESNLSSGRKKLAYQKLQQMVDYAYTDQCLRGYILDYFGEEEIAEQCDNCSNCQADYQEVDITLEAKKILSCIYRLQERYGITKVAKVLRGSRSKGILSLNLDQLSTYGIMQNYTIKEIKNLIKFLIAEKYIQLTEGKYAVTKLTPKAYPVLKGEQRVKQRVRQETEKIVQDSELFTILQKLRKEIAQEENVPPFVIFNNNSLLEMTNQLPVNKKQMLKISGVGEFKLKKYGTQFIEKIKSYCESNNLNRTLTRKAPQKEKVKSHIKSYQLYHDGKTLAEVADSRDLALSTVQNHILRAAKEGLEVDLEALIPNQYRQLIIKQIKASEGSGLKPIKEALPSEITYFQIKAMSHKLREGS